MSATFNAIKSIRGNDFRHASDFHRIIRNIVARVRHVVRHPVYTENRKWRKRGRIKRRDREAVYTRIKARRSESEAVGRSYWTDKEKQES